MTTWPGTNIPRSTGNAFDWRGGTSKITSTREFRMSQAATKQMAGRGKRTEITIKRKPK